MTLFMNVMSVYECTPKDHIRIVLFDINNRYIPIFWFETGLDASLYFGIRRNDVPILKKAQKYLIIHRILLVLKKEK